jgi:hypothetical protein
LTDAKRDGKVAFGLVVCLEHIFPYHIFFEAQSIRFCLFLFFFKSFFCFCFIYFQNPKLFVACFVCFLLSLDFASSKPLQLPVGSNTNNLRNRPGKSQSKENAKTLPLTAGGSMGGSIGPFVGFNNIISTHAKAAQRIAAIEKKRQPERVKKVKNSSKEMPKVAALCFMTTTEAPTFYSGPGTNTVGVSSNWAGIL